MTGSSPLELTAGAGRSRSLMAEVFTPGHEGSPETRTETKPKPDNRWRRAGKRLGRWRWPLLVLALLLLVLVVVLVLRLVLGPVVPVALAERRELVVRVVATGRVVPASLIQLAAPAAGEVEQVEVDEGDRVKQGALLARLDDEQALAAVAEARAGLAEARARLQQLERVGSQQSSEELRQARIQLRNAQRQLARIQKLFAAGGATEQELDDARSEVRLARSRVDAAAAAAASDEPSGSDYRVAVAAVEQAEARLATAEARLEDTRVQAPAAGEILAVAIEPGDFVQVGEPLFELAEAGPPRLVAQPDEKNLGLLEPGEPALASADAFPDRTFEAVVDSVSPAVDPQRGTIEVELRIPDPPDYLRTDMTVSVDIEAAREPSALVIPAAAVRGEDAGEPFVFVVRGNRVRRQPVDLGIPGEGRVQVVSGLQAGDAVVLPEDGTAVEPGDRVRTRRVGE